MRHTGKAGGAGALPATLRAALLPALALPLFAALAACQDDNDPGPGGVTVAEGRALDDAAQMLDQQRLPTEPMASPDAKAGTESVPAD